MSGTRDRRPPADNDPKVAAWRQKWRAESDAIDCHPLEWLRRRIADLTDIDISDLKEAAMRLNSGFGLGAFEPEEDFLPKYPNLCSILPKLHALDRDGWTDQIVQELVKKYPKHEAVAKLAELELGRSSGGTRSPQRKRRRKRQKQTELTLQEEKVWELLKKRWTQAQIATELDLTPGRISQLAASAKKKNPSSRSVNVRKAATYHDNISSDRTPAQRSPRQRKGA